MNTANKLTVFRIILIPIFVFVFLSPFSYHNVIALFVFVLAGFTDFLDGFIARKYNMKTKVGTVLDPLADKLMLMALIVSLRIKDLIPIWVLVVIVSKEILMILFGLLLYKKDFIIPSNIIGKLSTTLFYIAIGLLILNVKWSIFLLYSAILLSIIAFISYFIAYKKISKTKKDL